MKIIKSVVLGQIVVLFIGLLGCTPSMSISTSKPEPVVTHAVAEIHNVEPIWNINKVYVSRQDFCPQLGAAMGKVCYLGDFGKPQDYFNVICIDSNAGTVLWDEEAGQSPGLIVTSDGIFITYIRQPSPGYLAKVNPLNGDLVWKNDLGPFNTTLYLSFINGQIQLFADGNDHFFIFDTDGNLVNETAARIFASFPDQTYKNLTGVDSYKTGTNDLIWQYGDFINLVPLFTQDKIFFRNLKGMAKALDRETGRPLWSTADIISNIAYSPAKKLVYVLRGDGDLLGIDENSGQESVIAKFSSVPFIDNGNEASTYQIAYDEQEHIIIVSLGDSSQLFAFKEK